MTKTTALDLTNEGYAAKINQHHEEAQLLAGEAVNHAKLAGALLLQAKAQMAHGEFLPWLESQCKVSPRQAQRYMRAAQEKPLDRIAKNDTVSHLTAPPKPGKESRILEILRSGESLTRFDAERHGDHCLNTTVAKLRAKGHNILGVWESVPGRFSDEVRCLRYSYGGVDQQTDQLDLLERMAPYEAQS